MDDTRGRERASAEAGDAVTGALPETDGFERNEKRERRRPTGGRRRQQTRPFGRVTATVRHLRHEGGRRLLGRGARADALAIRLLSRSANGVFSLLVLPRAASVFHDSNSATRTFETFFARGPTFHRDGVGASSAFGELTAFFKSRVQLADLPIRPLLSSSRARHRVIHTAKASASSSRDDRGLGWSSARGRRGRRRRLRHHRHLLRRDGTRTPSRIINFLAQERRGTPCASSRRRHHRPGPAGGRRRRSFGNRGGALERGGGLIRPSPSSRCRGPGPDEPPPRRQIAVVR